MTNDQVRDFERIFVGNYQRSVSHFYPIGKTDDGKQRFAFGYSTPDGVFQQGFTVWHGEHFRDEQPTQWAL